MDVERYECTTSKEVENHEFEIIWNVQKCVVQDLIDTNGRQESFLFHSKFYNSSWYLVLKTSVEYPDHFGIFLYLKNAEIDLTYTFRCLVKNGLIVLDRFTEDFTDYKGGYNGWGWREWIKKDELIKDSNWTDDFIKIVVEVKVKTEKQTFTKEKVAKQFKASDELMTDIASLTQSGLYSDVTLNVGGQKFKAHKLILAIRCEYFSTMFGSHFKEASDTEVIIKDIEEEDFECLFKFIYTGKFTHNPTSNIPRLLTAADRLALVNFVEYCEKLLEENMTIENCLESYQVADLCSRHYLKVIVLKFIKANIKNIKKTDAWKKLKAENMALICNILESIFEN